MSFFWFQGVIFHVDTVEALHSFVNYPLAAIFQGYRISKPSTFVSIRLEMPWNRGISVSDMVIAFLILNVSFQLTSVRWTLENFEGLLSNKWICIRISSHKCFCVYMLREPIKQSHKATIFHLILCLGAEKEPIQNQNQDNGIFSVN